METSNQFYRNLTKVEQIGILTIIGTQQEINENKLMLKLFKDCLKLECDINLHRLRIAVINDNLFSCMIITDCDKIQLMLSKDIINNVLKNINGAKKSLLNAINSQGDILNERNY